MMWLLLGLFVLALVPVAWLLHYLRYVRLRRQWFLTHGNRPCSRINERRRPSNGT